MSLNRTYYAIRKGNRWFTGTTHGVFSDRHQPKLYTGLGVIRALVTAARGYRKDDLKRTLSGARVVPVRVEIAGEGRPIEEVIGADRED